MKTEIKIDRIKNKIVKLEEELAGLRSSIGMGNTSENLLTGGESFVKPADSSGQYMDTAQPVAPAVYEQGEEFTDHLVTRGAKY